MFAARKFAAREVCRCVCNGAAALSAAPQQIIADSLQRRLLLMTESAAVLPEIAGYTNYCWLTQVATLAGACLQFAHEDHTQICRSVIFANFVVML